MVPTMWNFLSNDNDESKDGLKVFSLNQCYVESAIEQEPVDIVGVRVMDQINCVSVWDENMCILQNIFNTD